MATWTLEQAKNSFSEVVRRALRHVPQVVERGGRDAVVVIAREDYERLLAPQGLVEFMRGSPLAAAMAAGELDASAFVRDPDFGRDVAL
ncbi:MAG: type II toxin-antitoxin system Phd/YefM family antitoxin [Gemmatimonadetes bacterium]|nr:type II toxin-antitoxin system Phd/YefM family antitoxin [Gemmatimonadota bacterium]